MKTILRNWMVPEPRGAGGAGDEGNPTPLTGGQVMDSKELSSLSLLPSIFSSVYSVKGERERSTDSTD